jgi:Ser/Thr protein kinase RdoA (MazF antagonist)
MGHALLLHGGGLGLPGAQVLNALDHEEGQTRTQLAHATGIKPPTVGRVLARLEALGAAQRGGDREWFSVLSFDADLTARNLGLERRLISRDARMDAEAAEHRRAIEQARQSYIAAERPPATDVAVGQ